jgi:hypothetical protein
MRKSHFSRATIIGGKIMGTIIVELKKDLLILLGRQTSVFDFIIKF